MNQGFAQFVPLLPVFALMLVACAAKSFISAMRFAALVRAMQEKGYEVDRASVSALLKVWTKRPERIVVDSDPAELKSLKAEHAAECGRRVRLPKIAIWLTSAVLAVGAFYIIFMQ